MSIKKVLVANRGEIVSRIIRSCRSRGVKAVVVFSEADQDLPYVRMADEAICIGPPPVAKSYLNMEAIIQVAKETGADAIHPGYGLLSENAEFAERSIQEGLIWIGPDPKVIAMMGDKVTARKTMVAAGVPVVPGTEGLTDIAQAMKEAEMIGYPVMIKASAGGGGIGMQICRSASEIEKNFTSAQVRAKAYFGNDTLFMEKWIDSSRHVEVQIAGDIHGKVVHLYERECSVQRRNQKVIEESLSPSIRSKTRLKLYEAALKAAQSVHYTGVGTIEFLVGPDEEFYFLEMNTRLQVEHPVTESITGLDLVALQIDLAQGKALPWSQADIPCRGHAIEFRIYAEDPQTFLPSPGKLTMFQPPSGEGVRIDTGVEEGSTISPFYDPMIAKCIVSGFNREETLARSKQALRSFRIEGIKSNLPLHLRMLEDDRFISGFYDTQLIIH